MQYSASSLAVRPTRNVAAHGAKFTDPKKVLVQTVKDDTLKENLLGQSSVMKNKSFVDSTGKKGKGMGVYQFADKYGTNVDGYSPIYSPDEWSESGGTYSLGARGLLAWAGLVVVLLAVGFNLIVATSDLA